MTELQKAEMELAAAYAAFPPIGRCIPEEIEAAAARVNAALLRRLAALEGA